LAPRFDENQPSSQVGKKRQIGKGGVLRIEAHRINSDTCWFKNFEIRNPKSETISKKLKTAGGGRLENFAIRISGLFRISIFDFPI
jgi:hypothetical protein